MTSLLSLVTWAIYFMCWILQNEAILVVLVNAQIFIIIYICPVQTIRFGNFYTRLFCFFFSLQIFRGTFLRLKPFLTILLRNPCQMDSSFLSSVAKRSHDWQLYRRRLLTQASNNLIRVDRKILLSVKTCFNSFHFWYADEMR